jgi:hypothetical protein
MMYPDTGRQPHSPTLQAFANALCRMTARWLRLRVMPHIEERISDPAVRWETLRDVLQVFESREPT